MSLKTTRKWCQYEADKDGSDVTLDVPNIPFLVYKTRDLWERRKQPDRTPMYEERTAYVPPSTFKPSRTNCRCSLGHTLLHSPFRRGEYVLKRGCTPPSTISRTCENASSKAPLPAAPRRRNA